MEEHKHRCVDMCMCLDTLGHEMMDRLIIHV